MKPLQIRPAILLIGAGAAVIGVAGFRDAKSSALRASPDPQVKVQEDERAINLAAAEKGDSRTKATSTLQGFRERITKAKAEKDREKRMALLAEAVQTLDPSQIREALAEVEAMKDERFQTRLRNMLLSRWGESDPKAALAYIQGLNLDGGSFPFDVVKSVISSWAEKDFTAAKAWVEGLPLGTYRRRSAMVDLAFALAQKDPAAALSLARSLPADDGQRFLSGALNGWCLKDAEAAIAYAVQLPDVGNWTLVLMFDKIASKDPDKAIKMLEKIPSENQQNEALRKIGLRWAISDPNAALDWANQQTDPKVKSEILQGVIGGMAQKDPERALELAQSLPANEREGRIDYILGVLSESDPEGAVGYAMNLPSNKSKNFNVSRLAGQWISSDPQGALGWFDSLTDPKLKEQVAGAMIDNLPKDDLATSLKLLDTMPPGFFQNQALSRIGRNWAQTDQKAALDWANVQTDPEVKSEILGGVIQGMSVKDPNSAFQLVQSLPAGNSRNRIIITSLGSMAQSDPQSAIALASGIAEAHDRLMAQANVVRSWKRRDPTAANQWVNSSSLPQDEKAMMLREE